MNIRPLQDRVVVRRVDAETTTRGGIIIPDSATEKPVQGDVIAVGDGSLLDDGSRRSLDVRVGDRVLFGKYSGSEVKLNGMELVVMHESDIMAIIDTAESEEAKAA